MDKYPNPTRSQIVRFAKSMVLSFGPHNVLEFGMERIEENQPLHGWSEEICEEIDKEAKKQAERVFRFLDCDELY
jgi:hypothetical protein